MMNLCFSIKSQLDSALKTFIHFISESSSLISFVMILMLQILISIEVHHSILCIIFEIHSILSFVIAIL